MLELTALTARIEDVHPLLLGDILSIRIAALRAASLSLATAGLLALSSPFSASATGTNLLVNPGFEDPSSANNGDFVDDADFPGWETTDSEGVFEVWTHEDDSQYIELNAYSNGAVYQDVATTPCAVLTWTVDHRARMVGTDTMHVLAGAAGGVGEAGLDVLEATSRDGDAITATTEIADTIETEGDDTAWSTWSGTYTVPAGQTTTRIAFKAISATGWNDPEPTAGNFLDTVELTSAPGECLAETGVDASGIALGGFALVGLGAVVAIRRRARA